MLVIKIGPRSLAVLGMMLALSVGLVLGSLRPAELAAAASRARGPEPAAVAAGSGRRRCRAASPWSRPRRSSTAHWPTRAATTTA